MSEKWVWIAVAPEFRKKLKVESSLHDMSMVDYSRQLAKMPTIDSVRTPSLDEKEKRRFRIGF